MGADSEEVIEDFPFNQKEAVETSFGCEFCGREFTTRRGRNIHQGQAHIEELKE
jgi:transcription initiation factor IIE alpha subunit